MNAPVLRTRKPIELKARGCSESSLLVIPAGTKLEDLAWQAGCLADGVANIAREGMDDGSENSLRWPVVWLAELAAEFAMAVSGELELLNSASRRASATGGDA